MTVRNLDALLNPDAVVCVGAADSPAALRMLARLRAATSIPLFETGAELDPWPAERGCMRGQIHPPLAAVIGMPLRE